MVEPMVMHLVRYWVIRMDLMWAMNLVHYLASSLV